eukprot:TRINITY_DN14534_c0_g1_i7.p1 TRINITY_DN14534_c0_g1~~TRINITY_DN14534_c0_g1_i7.p1  ORF type:complete len:312 (-),score=81.56 TRINITY_DN14534_c0_g1_i7:111-1046(-)
MSLFSYEAFVNACSGATGAGVATTVLYPFDRIKVALHKAPEPDEEEYKDTSEAFWGILKKQGPAGLLQGCGWKIGLTTIQRFIYFYSYRFLMDMWTKRFGRPGTLANLFIGYVSGVIQTFWTLPVEVANTKSTANGKPFFQVLREIMETEGWRGLFNGLKLSILLCVNPAIQYTAQEQLRGLLLKSTGRDPKNTRVILGAFEAFWLGAVAKIVSTLTTFPLIRAKIIMQTTKRPTVTAAQAVPSPEEKRRQIPRTMGGILGYVVEKEGPGGLYKGVNSQLTKGVLNAALMLVIKEKADGVTRAALAAMFNR